MLLTDDKAAAIEEERAWARKLADGFDTTGKAKARRADSTPKTPLARYQEALNSPEELIQRASCASEFKYRKRPWFWLVFVADGLILWGFAVMQEMSGIWSGWTAWLFVLGAMAFSNYMLWLRAYPYCPNCKQHIRSCPANNCLCCGEALSHGRCADCGVDHSWTGFFRPYQNGMYSRIHYCPGCGVHLDTWVRRWRARE